MNKRTACQNKGMTVSKMTYRVRKQANDSFENDLSGAKGFREVRETDPSSVQFWANPFDNRPYFERRNRSSQIIIKE